jgi:hypothetical protein
VRKTGGYCGPGGAKYQRLYLYLIIFNYIIILMGSKRPWPRGSADIFSFKADASAADLRRGFEWKSMKIPQNQWKSMKIIENQWTSMKINKNQRDHQWKSMNNQWKSMKINEHHWFWRHRGLRR